MPENALVHLTLRGQVQGVNFRDFTKRLADSLGLVGYVENMADSTVLVVAEGRRSSMGGFIEALMAGPPRARVISTDTKWLAPSGTYPDFSIRD
jgi:acylphosphatase